MTSGGQTFSGVTAPVRWQLARGYLAPRLVTPPTVEAGDSHFRCAAALNCYSS